MKIISKEANPSGSYFGPQDWPDGAAPPEERVAGIEAAIQEGLSLYEGDLGNG